MKRFFLIILISCSVQILCGQTLDFYREDLRFSLNSEYFLVEGDYFFRNNTSADVSQLMRYPFPDTSKYGQVDSVFCIAALSGEDCMIGEYNGKWIMFRVNIPAKDTGKYIIGYRQQTRGKEALYILTTTQKWGKPFEYVCYQLSVNGLVVDSLSYIPDKVSMSGDTTLFYWEKRDFMPRRDFVVQFIKK